MSFYDEVYDDTWDTLRTEQESEAYETWAAEHAEQLEEQAYEAWAEPRMEDGEDYSRTAYEAWIDSQIPDDPE